MQTKNRSEDHGAGGVTSVEFMIVLCVIAILGMILQPTLQAAVRNANESTSRANLKSLRKALELYRAVHEGAYPPDLRALDDAGGGASEALRLHTVAHGATEDVRLSASFDPAADDGVWGYVVEEADRGRVWVRCTHTDSKGTLWTRY